MNNTTINKRYSALALVLILAFIFLMPVSAYAAEVLWDSYEIPSSRQKELVYDNADLLTDSDEAALLQQFSNISSKWNCNVALLTTNSHTGPIQDYADDYFDYNGFGADYNKTGILFMLSMEDREWAISTSGEAIQAFTDYGQEYMMDKVMPYLRDGDYYEAFEKYGDVCDYLLGLYAQGTPYDVGYKAPRTSADTVRTVLLSILIGLVVALIPIGVMKSQLKTVAPANNASAYQSSKGINLRVKEDHFIRKTLTKTPIPKDTGSKGGSFGGGSSTHSSSSGSSHGGSHGHF